MKFLSLAKNSYWSIIDVLVGTGFGFIISILLARILGPEIFGRYSFLVTVSSLIVAFSSSGIAIILLREAVKKKRKFTHYLQSTISIFIFYSLPVILVISVLLYFTTIQDIDFLYSIAFQIGMMFFGLIILLFINLQRYDLSTRFNFFYRISFLTILLFMIYVLNYSISLKFIFVLNFILLIILFIIGIYTYNVSFQKKININFKYKLYKKYIFISYPVLGAALAEIINLKLDTIMLGILSTNFEVGIYSAAYNFYLGFIMIPLALTKAYSPTFIEKSKVGFRNSSKLFYLYLFLFFLYSVLVVIFLGLFSNSLIAIIYTDAYLEAGEIIFYLALALPFIVNNRLVNYSMIAVGKQKIYMYYTIVGTIINFTVNLYLIPVYGAFGAVIATILTEFIIFLIGIIFLLNFFKVNKYKSL